VCTPAWHSPGHDGPEMIVMSLVEAKGMYDGSSRTVTNEQWVREIGAGNNSQTCSNYKSSTPTARYSMQSDKAKVWNSGYFRRPSATRQSLVTRVETNTGTRDSRLCAPVSQQVCHFRVQSSICERTCWTGRRWRPQRTTRLNDFLLCLSTTTLDTRPI